ncbi:unnamed protein product [Prunus brigantina]
MFKRIEGDDVVRDIVRVSTLTSYLLFAELNELLGSFRVFSFFIWCILCKSVGESVDHVFLSCRFS